MSEFESMMQSAFRYALYMMSACLLAWAFIPGAKPYAAGLVLGVLISLVNARILHAKIHALTQAALENNGKRVNFGFISRVCMVLIGTMIALKFSQFNLVTTVAGFFFVQAATWIRGITVLLARKIPYGKR
ncbi:ATP synthase subunit I [Gorillibacterium sp. sgz5001074]|uniref:ATP synthase subunit I n=1 Tax=Gorillibacterium sp. sgz5001074 TaxID=3446695 RepID=UPI003F66F7DC